ncbi:MAG: hypothetical protein ABW217_11495 [Polyangiaceae bacterium]
MFKIALPILGVTSSLAAEAFWCGKLGDLLDQDWGNLEINLVDQDGNRIVISQSKGAAG